MPHLHLNRYKYIEPTATNFLYFWQQKYQNCFARKSDYYALFVYQGDNDPLHSIAFGKGGFPLELSLRFIDVLCFHRKITRDYLPPELTESEGRARFVSIAHNQGTICHFAICYSSFLYFRLLYLRHENWD